MDLEGRVHPLESGMYVSWSDSRQDVPQPTIVRQHQDPRNTFLHACPPLAVIWCYEVQLSGSQVMADLTVLSEEKMASHQFILQIRQLANTLVH